MDLSFNLETILWLLLLLCFICWLILRAHIRRSGDSQNSSWFVEFFGSFFPIFLIIMLLRSFVYEPFRIPSPSMEPTLYSGDMILVNKWTYGLKLPLLGTPLTEGNAPQRGDVVVFKKPGDNQNFFIKRVIGVPGDKVRYSGKQLTINGEAQSLEVLSEPSEATGNRYLASEQIDSSDADNPASIEHEIFFSPFQTNADNHMYTIPDGEYFMMGDNRDNSQDSRFWGMVPEENIVGRASLIWMNLNCVTFQGGCDRIGTVLQ